MTLKVARRGVAAMHDVRWSLSERRWPPRRQCHHAADDDEGLCGSGAERRRRSRTR
jgi:hypothetical protein